MAARHWRALGCALALLLLIACGQPPQDQAIIQAATSYVRENSAVDRFTVTVEKVDGDYARARVVPSDGSADPAWVFLKREQNAWQGLTIGTAFDDETYRELGIPDDLRTQ